MDDLLSDAQQLAFRFSFLACGHAEDAEDVMQDALLRTFRHVRRIREPEAFRAWLYRTVRNACLMKRRRHVGEPVQHASHLDAVHLPDRAPLPDEAAINKWLGRRLRAALLTLPPMHRIVVFLREIEGLSTTEVARVLEISEPNVKTRLHRARAQLREQLEGSRPG
jgi:RNA polymerase sigma-70 factor (ECF subfamily)